MNLFLRITIGASLSINSMIPQNSFMTIVARQSNIELLRIICMLFIISGHIRMFHGDGYLHSSSFAITSFLLPFFLVAVNVFVLISGYFGIKFNAKKLLALNDMTTFWSILLLVVAFYIGEYSLNLKTDWKLLLPVLTKKYWFITVYFALCALTPLLNEAVEKISQNTFKWGLITMFIMFVLQSTFSAATNSQPIETGGGYNIVTFVQLYLTGRYIKMYQPHKKFSALQYMCGFILSCLGCGIFQYVFSMTVGFEFTSLFSYDTIFIFIGALALFLCFLHINIGSIKFINWLAIFCLPAYVIHLHPVFGDILFKSWLHVDKFSTTEYLLSFLWIPIAIYIACVALEWVHMNTFGRITDWTLNKFFK